MSNTLVIGQIDKRPDEILLRGLDWASVLAKIGGGVTLQTSSWYGDNCITLSSLSFAGSKTIVKISSGFANNAYIIWNHVILSDNQEYTRGLRVLVE